MKFPWEILACKQCEELTKLCVYGYSRPKAGKEKDRRGIFPRVTNSPRTLVFLIRLQKFHKKNFTRKISQNFYIWTSQKSLFCPSVCHGDRKYPPPHISHNLCNGTRVIHAVCDLESTQDRNDNRSELEDIA